MVWPLSPGAMACSRCVSCSRMPRQVAGDLQPTDQLPTELLWEQARYGPGRRRDRYRSQLVAVCVTPRQSEGSGCWPRPAAARMNAAVTCRSAGRPGTARHARTSWRTSAAIIMVFGMCSGSAPGPRSDPYVSTPGHDRKPVCTVLPPELPAACHADRERCQPLPELPPTRSCASSPALVWT
jgi:hypothetical protein